MWGKEIDMYFFIFSHMIKLDYALKGRNFFIQFKIPLNSGVFMFSDPVLADMWHFHLSCFYIMSEN